MLTWGTSSGALSYEYCVDSVDNATCDSVWAPVYGLNATVNGLDTDTRYFWQVRSRNSAGASEADSGAWWSFTTDSRPIFTDGSLQSGMSVVKLVHITELRQSIESLRERYGLTEPLWTDPAPT